MINNQIQSPVTGKNSVMSGHGSEESKKEAGKQQGGLFKLLMSSVQDGELSGKKGQSSGANILGGNLTLNTSKEGEGKQSALHLLAGSGEESKEEKITLSKLLEGSGSTAESSSGSTEESNSESAVETTGDETLKEEVNAEAATNDDENSSEADSKKVESKGEPADGEEQSDGESADLTEDVEKQTPSETQAKVEGGTAQEGKVTAATDDQNSAQAASNNLDKSGTQVSQSGHVAGHQGGDGAIRSGEADNVKSESKGGSQQVTAPSGKTVTVGSGSDGSHQKAAPVPGEGASAGSGSQESNPLNGLIAEQGSTEKVKQTGFGSLFAGEKVMQGEGMADGRGRGDGNTAVRPEQVKSEGLVNELRTLAAAQSEQLLAGQQQRHVPTEQQSESVGSGETKDGALIKEIFFALQNGSIEQVAAEIRSLKASQLRETKYSNYMSSFANRQEISNSGSAFSSGSGSSTSATATGSKATMMPLSTMVPTGASVTSEMMDENGAVLWKEQITEYFESNEKSASENQAAAAFARLGEVPVTNISVRRSFAQGISQAIINTAGQGKKGSEVWQKHNFVLEDGKNIQVSAREVEGVLHLKLSSSYNELNKLLMDHENEIRDLLENELALKVDLQMDGGGDGSAADFFGGASGQQSGNGNGPLDLGSLKKTAEQTIEEVVPKAVRKFGYNQMEWTV